MHHFPVQVAETQISACDQSHHHGRTRKGKGAGGHVKSAHVATPGHGGTYAHAASARHPFNQFPAGSHADGELFGHQCRPERAPEKARVSMEFVEIMGESGALS